MRKLLITFGALALVGGLTLVVTSGQPTAPHSQIQSPADPTVAAALPYPIPHRVAEPAAPASAGALVIPSVSLNAPLKTMPAAATIDPPGPHAAYRVTGPGYGDLADSKTTYVAMHASFDPDDQSIPGNHLYDADAQSTKIQPNALIYANGHAFSVTRIAVIPKSELATTRAVWDQSSDLILISCAEARDATSSATSNVVVFAKRVGS